MNTKKASIPSPLVLTFIPNCMAKMELTVKPHPHGCEYRQAHQRPVHDCI